MYTYRSDIGEVKYHTNLLCTGGESAYICECMCETAKKKSPGTMCF